MPACRKIIAKKVADKGNQQQRGCSLSRKWSHTRSRCKIDAVYFPKGTAPKCGAEVEAKSAAIAVQASSGRQRHRRHQSGEREKPGSGVLPQCIFNLTMNEMLRKAKSKEIADGDMLCSLFAVGEKTYQARIRRTALSIYRQQSRILYNSTMEIGKFTKNESTNDSDNQPRRAEASRQRPARKNGNRTNATKRRQPYD